MYTYLTFSSQGLEKLKRKRNEHKQNLILSWERKYFTYICISMYKYTGTYVHTCTSTHTQARVCVFATYDYYVTIQMQ